MNKRISFIGAGRVAWHLAPALENVGYPVSEVWSRTEASARALCGRLYEARLQDSLDFQHSNAQIFVLAVSDDALAQISEELILPDEACIVHTSGSKPLSILETAGAAQTGVFYPLQTFSKERNPDFRQIPLCLEAETPSLLKELERMAKALGSAYYFLNSEQRRQLHVAAVFASNFTNHLLHIAHQWLHRHKLPDELLDALVAETVNKSLELGPQAAQTGPARRGDAETLALHLDQLESQPAWAELYYLISEDIRKTYQS